MKFKVMMKNPDALDEAIDEAVEASLDNTPVSEDEREMLAESRRDEIRTLCGKWFEYGEYLRVEVDTVAETCTIVTYRK